MEQWVERIAKTPVATKIALLGATLLVLTLINFFVTGLPFGASIQATDKKITQTLAEQRRLDGEYIEKQAIANDLNRFRREREMLEQRLKEALAELPEGKNLDELLQSFQDRAQKSGLEIASIVPAAPATDQFYVRIPIEMRVSGNFHEVVTFLDAVGHLRRIVNVSDITMDNPKEAGGKVLLTSSFTATTFMFAETKKATP